jgi:hypothetical protein
MVSLNIDYQLSNHKNIKTMEDTLTISAQKVRETYKNACKEGKKILEGIFGEDALKPKNIMDKIKSVQDAIDELGEDHILVKQYHALLDAAERNNDFDMLAYARLRIIAAALNEGWKPKFTKDEYRYYPYFYFYTKEQYNRLSEEAKEKCCLLGGAACIGSAAGVAYALSSYGVALSHTSVGSRVCFKSSELAEYAGVQFKELWRDFLYTM